MTAIEWTEKTWNPVTGCSKVSPGCAHCYAERLALGKLKGSKGYPGLPWTPENAAENVVLHPERLDEPLRRRIPTMWFVNSMSDLFHEEIPHLFIGRIFNVMGRAQQHTFQVLTKRPERMRDFVRRYLATINMPPPPNVWLGTSIENRHFVHRADLLRETPAAVRFVSAEPLLGPLVTEGDPANPQSEGFLMRGPKRCLLDLTDIDWLIVGGESGPGHRPMRVEWVRDLRDAAKSSGTAFFFKQYGGQTPKAGGRELDGRTWDEYPQRALEALAA